MAKKGSRPNKANQQRTREEQWRRRAATQSGGATSVVDNYGATAHDGVTADDEAAFATVEIPSAAVAPRSTTSTSASARSTQTRVQGSTSAAASVASQRRGTSLTRQGRARYAPSAMSIEDEMYYVRSDIRRLVFLTAACVAVLILLYFVIPK